jgi:hypothetical protein
MNFKERAPLGLVLVLGLIAACSSDSNGQDSGPPAATCTPQNTEQAVDSSDISKLLAAAVDQPSRDTLRAVVIESCCPECPGGSANDRPLLADTETCIQCAGNYSAGNPADHVKTCAASVCRSQ